jgi:hypothetical protein
VRSMRVMMNLLRRSIRLNEVDLEPEDQYSL